MQWENLDENTKAIVDFMDWSFILFSSMEEILWSFMNRVSNKLLLL